MKIKKVCAWVLIICISILLAACSVAKSKGSNLSETANNNETGTSENNTQMPSGDVAMVTIESYSDYVSYLEGFDLPDSFIPYEALAQFGEFKSFHTGTASAWQFYGPDYYSYMLVDESGTELRVAIRHDYDYEAFLAQLKSINKTDVTDMQHHDPNENGYYLNNGIYYTYVSGKLNSLKWAKDGAWITVSISGDGMYPENVTNTMYAKLLNVETAESVTESISVALADK